MTSHRDGNARRLARREIERIHAEEKSSVCVLSRPRLQIPGTPRAVAVSVEAALISIVSRINEADRLHFRAISRWSLRVRPPRTPGAQEVRCAALSTPDSHGPRIA